MQPIFERISKISIFYEFIAESLRFLYPFVSVN